jgi:hypothetical protein
MSGDEWRRGNKKGRKKGKGKKRIEKRKEKERKRKKEMNYLFKLQFTNYIDHIILGNENKMW